MGLAEEHHAVAVAAHARYGKPRFWQLLCVFVLAQAAALLVPIVIAVLIAFLLTPLVSNLQRRIGRIPAVMVVVLICIAIVVALGLFVFQEMAALGSALASYRSNIRAKIADVRGLASGGVVEQLEALIADVSKQLSKGVQAPPRRVVLEQPGLITATSVSAVLGPALGWLANAAVISVSVAWPAAVRSRRH